MYTISKEEIQIEVICVWHLGEKGNMILDIS